MAFSVESDVDAQRPMELDTGLIVDGEVVLDALTNEVLILDGSGEHLPIERHLRGLVGCQIRLTCIKLESIEAIEKLLVQGG